MKKSQLLYISLKNIADIILSAFALIIISPLLIIVSILIKIDSKGPVLFKQRRVGKDNTHFNIYKFRTMSTDAPSEMATDQLHDAKTWVTNLGGFLRKTSIDELPQLINILRGEMSFVGPRPALWNQDKLNSLRLSNDLHKIKPGLTGLAQINGRDENDDEEKVFWDKLYFKKISFTTDMKCLFFTIVSVISRKGIVEGVSDEIK